MIRRIKLTNIRCFTNANFEFAPGVNLIIGPNGSGKTTVLEAASVFSFGRFQSIESDFFAVSGKEGVGRVELEAELGGAKKEFAVSILDGEKQFRVNGKKKFLSAIIGSTKTVFFNPETIDLVSGPPQIRRRELDFTIAQRHKKYVHLLLDFRKVLKHRNSLLKLINAGRSQKGELDYWDSRFCALSVEIYKKRHELVSIINRQIAKVHSLLVEKEKALAIKYLPSVDYSRIQEHLAAVCERDLFLGLTSVGPHRDDFVLLVGDFELKSGGSRGEQRMAAIAFKVETKKYLTIPTESVRTEPILVLDDIFSELDEKRREAVAKILASHQAIISATDKRVVPEAILHKAKIITL